MSIRIIYKYFANLNCFLLHLVIFWKKVERDHCQFSFPLIWCRNSSCAQCAIVTVAIRISARDFLVTIKSTINQLCLLDLAPGGGLINKNTIHHVLQNFYRAFQSEWYILDNLFTMLSGRTAARKMPRTQRRHTGEIIKRNLSWVWYTSGSVIGKYWNSLR